jgi:hypothetical protein
MRTGRVKYIEERVMKWFDSLGDTCAVTYAARDNAHGGTKGGMEGGIGIDMPIFSIGGVRGCCLF